MRIDLSVYRLTVKKSYFYTKQDLKCWFSTPLGSTDMHMYRADCDCKSCSRIRADRSALRCPHGHLSLDYQRVGKCVDAVSCLVWMICINLPNPCIACRRCASKMYWHTR
jgi:hypothetical protein